MSDGWIKLHRKMRDWQHYQNPSVRMVFEDLLLAANSKTTNRHGIEILRGETTISISSLEYNTGLSRKTVINALKTLEKTGEIKRIRYSDGVKTVILNFARYQGDCDEGSVNIQPVTTPPITPVTTPPITPVTTPVVTPPIPPEQELKEREENNILQEKKKDKRKKEPPEGVLFTPPPKPRKPKSQDDFVPPTLKEVEAVFRQSANELPNWQDEARIFFYHYDGLGWRNTHGVKIRNWDSFANKWIFDKINEARKSKRPPNQGVGDQRQQERDNLARDYAATIARRIAEDKARAEEIRKP